MVLELSGSSVGTCVRNSTDSERISLREEMVMKKYMIIALKHITKVNYTKGMSLNERFYLLEGRVCYYHGKSKTLLGCYEEGVFNPKEMGVDQEFRLYVF